MPRRLLLILCFLLLPACKADPGPAIDNARVFDATTRYHVVQTRKGIELIVYVRNPQGPTNRGSIAQIDQATRRLAQRLAEEEGRAFEPYNANDTDVTLHERPETGERYWVGTTQLRWARQRP